MNVKEEEDYYTGYLVMMSLEALASARKLRLGLKKINVWESGSAPLAIVT